MSIRCSAKVIILHEGKVLLNRCHHKNGQVYYDLPGGGQHPYENMREAAAREVLEETGYRVRITRFAALAEEIYTDPDVRARYPDYSHRICHIFRAELLDEQAQRPSETDFGMEKSMWVDAGAVDKLLQICPHGLKGRFCELLDAQYPLDLGTCYYADTEDQV